jgi:hypothetical protein
MLEVSNQRQPLTELDPLFEYDSRRLRGEVPDTSLGEIAAQINLNDVFVIGPVEGADPSNLPIQQRRQENELLGKPEAVYGRIVVGDEEYDRRLFYYADDINFSEIKAAKILAIVSSYDQEFAEQLFPVVARELLVHRNYDLNTGETTVGVRSKGEIDKMVGRLRKFADEGSDDGEMSEESGDVPVHSETYRSLATLVEAERLHFDAEKRGVIKATAEQRVVDYPREKRLSRWGWRAIGAAGLGTVIWTLSLTNGEPTVSDSIIVQSEDLAAEIRDHTLLIDDAEPIDDYASGERESVKTTQLLLLDGDLRKIGSVSEEAKTQEERGLVVKLKSMHKAASNAVDDKKISLEELRDISDRELEILDEAGYLSVNDTLAKAIIFTAYGGVGLFSLLMASRRGGRMDPRLKAYKRGELDTEDVSGSPAVNSDDGLGERIRITSKTMSVIKSGSK